jgi:tetratricopeptide (TPR) repeat protein
LRSSRYEGIALFWAGLCALNVGRFEEAAALIENSLRVTPATEAGTVIVIKFHEGLVRWWRGERAEAMRLYQEALAYFRETGFEFGSATVLSTIGDALLFEDDLVGAEAAFTESLGVLHRTGAHQRVPWPLAGLAAVSAARGEGVRAVTLWSAVGALRAKTDSSDHMMTLKLFRDRVEGACAQISEAARAAAVAAGSKMELSDVVAFALAA